MKRTLLACLLFGSLTAAAQDTAVVQSYRVHITARHTDVQQSGDRIINFRANATLDQSIDVASVPLGISVVRKPGTVSYDFEGMGEKTHYRSDTMSDASDLLRVVGQQMEGGPYESTADRFGKVFRVTSELPRDTLALEGSAAVIRHMFHNLIQFTRTPENGNRHPLLLVPARIKSGLTWEDTIQSPDGFRVYAYQVGETSDSSFTIDFTSRSMYSYKEQTMGMEAVTTMAQKSRGTMNVRSVDYLILYHKENFEGTGALKVANTSIPVSSVSELIYELK